MLDWFSGIVGYDASRMRPGKVFQTNGDGEQVWERDAWVTARGSFESGIQVTRSTPTPAMIEAGSRLGFLCAPEVLRLSGNPTKFLQGHNVGGPSTTQLGPVLQAMCRQFPAELRPLDADSDLLPSLHRNRVDVTTHCDLDGHDNVHEWLRQAESHTRSRHGRALTSHGTVYWGKNSRRWSAKAYCKECELKAHPPKDPDVLAMLLWAVRGWLRIELTLRRPELVDRGTLPDSILWDYMGKIEMHKVKFKSLPDCVTQVNARAAAVLQLWYDGHDVSEKFPRKTFYRYRKEIQKVTGIDVSIARDLQAPDAAPALLDLDELRRREVDQGRFPPELQRSLWGAR